MAVLGRLLISSAERLDLADFLSIDSFAAGDWKFYMKSLVGTDRPYILRGFDVIDPDLSIGTASISIKIADSIVYSPESTAGPFFHGLEEGNALSQPLVPELKKSTTNFVYLTLSIVDAAKDTRNFWNPDKEGGIGGEFAQDINTESVLVATVNVSASSFPVDTIPICKVVVDTTSVVSIEDTRDMMFRLGTGGASGDPLNNFPFRDLPTASFNRNEPSAVMNNALDPNSFQGGDKNIFTLKEWMDAVMTNIKELKATPYWYSGGAGSWPGSMSTLRADATHSTITASGSATHSVATVGQMNWDSDLKIRFMSGELTYSIASNAATTDVTLADNEVAYLNLVRGAAILPNLILTNASATVSSFGAVTWTTDLVAGDFIKVAVEGDDKYVEIASVDTPSTATLVNAYIHTSTGAGGGAALKSYGSYQTNAAPSTDRHIQVSSRLNVPLSENTFWMFFRDDNGGGTPKIFTRFKAGEIQQGETIDISDNTSAAITAYMGSAGESDDDPDYATLATGTKSAQANYNTTNSENLTIRASKLTSMMADKAQDKTIQLTSDHDNAVNTTNGAAQDITFTGGTPSMAVLMPSSADNGTIGMGSILSLNVNQSAVFTVNRNAALTLANLTNLTVVDTDSVVLDENTYVFAYRLADTDVHLWDGAVLVAGATVPSAAYLQLIIQQNKTAKLIKGGIWDWNLGTTTLSWSADAFISLAGVTNASNEINVGSVSLTSDGQAAYVSVNRVSGAVVITVSAADIASIANDDNIFIFARRTGDTTVVGDSLKLADGESGQLYASSSDQTLTYIGATTTADNDPDYTSSSGGSLAMPNFNTANSEDLTIRVAKLNSMLADSKQDLNIEFEPGIITWDGTNVTITSASISISGTTVGTNDVSINNLGSTALADNSALYVDISRTSGAALTLVSATLASLVPSQQRLILIRNINGNLLVK